MIIFTLLSSIVGFMSSGLPTFMKYFQDKQDKAHELAIIQLQMQAQRETAGERIQEIQIENANSQLTTLYENALKPTNIKLIDGINGLIRPIVALVFIGIYIAMKIPHIELLGQMIINQNHFNDHEMYLKTYKVLSDELWDHTDSCIFSAIISFYFGSRITSG